jgi:hypothetical protein
MIELRRRGDVAPETRAMGWLIDHLPGQALVRVTTSGLMGVEKIRAMAVEAMVAGIAHGARRFMIDHRKMLPALTHEDIFDLARINRSQGSQKPCALRSCAAPTRRERTISFFYEVRTRSKGASNIRRFNDYGQAMSWLLTP